MILNEYKNFKPKESLQEQYFGRNSYLDEVDEQFGKLLKIVHDYNNYVPGAKPNDPNGKNAGMLLLPQDTTEISKIIRNLEKIIKKQFNFKGVAITMYHMGMSNAMIVAGLNVVNRKQERANIISTKTGIRYKEASSHLNIFMSMELVCNPMLTDPRCLTAILLHEIGHHFYYETSFMYTITRVSSVVASLVLIVQNIKNKTVDSIMQAVGVLTSLLFMTPFVKGKVNKFLTNKDDVTNQAIMGSQMIASLFSNVTYIQSTVFRLMNIIPTLRSMLSMGASRAIVSPITGANYRNEQFADNFATMYGYGAEVVKYSRIFQTLPNNYVESLANRSKFFNLFNDTLHNINSVFMGFEDVHPSNVSRMLDQISYLEKQLSLLSDGNERERVKQDLKYATDELNKIKKEVQEKNLAKEGRVLSNIVMKAHLQTGGDLRYKITRNKGLKNGDYEILPSTNLKECVNMELDEASLLYYDYLMEYYYYDNDSDIDIDKPLSEAGLGFTLRNLSTILQSPFSSSSSDKYEGLKNKLIKLVSKCRSSEDIAYLLKDKSLGITQLTKLAQNVKICEGCKDISEAPKSLKLLYKKVQSEKYPSSKEIQDYIVWLKTEYTNILHARSKEIRQEKINKLK